MMTDTSLSNHRNLPQLWVLSLKKDSASGKKARSWWISINHPDMFPVKVFLQRVWFWSVFIAALRSKHSLSLCKQRRFMTGVFVGAGLIHRLSSEWELVRSTDSQTDFSQGRLACQIAVTQSGICTLTHTFFPQQGVTYPIRYTQHSHTLLQCTGLIRRPEYDDSIGFWCDWGDGGRGRMRAVIRCDWQEVEVVKTVGGVTAEFMACSRSFCLSMCCLTYLSVSLYPPVSILCPPVCVNLSVFVCPSLSFKTHFYFFLLG